MPASHSQKRLNPGGSLSLPRIARLIRLHSLLHSPRPYNCKDLAPMLKVSIRTIYRDLGTLRQADLNIEYDNRKGGYVIRSQESGAQVPRLSSDELSLILLAAYTSPLRDVAEMHELIDMAASKLMASANVELRGRMEDLISGYKSDMRVKGMNNGNGKIIASLIAGVRERKCVRLWFDDSTSTKMSVYGVALDSSGCTITGRSSADRTIVKIELPSVVSIELLDEKADIPPHFREQWRGEKGHYKVKEPASRLPDSSRRKPS